MTREELPDVRRSGRQDPELGTALATRDMEAGGIAAYAREQHELQAAFIVAMQRPRDEQKAFTRAMGSCDRPGFAEQAAYQFPRAGEQIVGPSVTLARELARIWGNIRHGIRIVSMDERWVHVEGWALDLETNTRVGNESKFKKLVYRKKGGWVEPDERDLRELVNKQGAICVRNALLQLLPGDLVDDAMTRSAETMRKVASDELAANKRAETVKRISKSFSEFGVTVAMLEAKCGHALKDVTPEEAIELRRIYAAIQQGQSKVDDYFETTKPQSSSASAPAPAPKKGEHVDYDENPFDKPGSEKPQPAKEKPKAKLDPLERVIELAKQLGLPQPSLFMAATNAAGSPVDSLEDLRKLLPEALEDLVTKLEWQMEREAAQKEGAS